VKGLKIITLSALYLSAHCFCRYKSLITEEILKDFYQRQNSRKKHMFVFLHERIFTGK